MTDAQRKAVIGVIVAAIVFVVLSILALFGVPVPVLTPVSPAVLLSAI